MKIFSIHAPSPTGAVHQVTEHNLHAKLHLQTEKEPPERFKEGSPFEREEQKYASSLRKDASHGTLTGGNIEKKIK